MVNQTIDGTLDISGPAQNSQFEVLTVDAGSFGNEANAVASFFILARDIGAAPPAGQTKFSVSGDGRLYLNTMGHTSPFDALTLDVSSFGTGPNSQASHFIVARDIGAAPPGGKPVFSVRGDGIVFGSGFAFPDGSTQTTAQQRGPQGATGPAGPRGPAGPQGPAGALPNKDVITTNSAGGGFISLLNPAGTGQTVQLSALAQAPSNGVVSVTDAAGSAQGVAKARIYVDLNGNGTIEASVKNFRTPHPNDSNVDIVYACVEGPEAAVYIRGTANLVNGQCVVELPEHFIAVAAERGITVQLTPMSAESLGLGIVSKSAEQIEVAELHGGSGSYEFDWEVKGVRKGHEDYAILRPRDEVRLTTQ